MVVHLLLLVGLLAAQDAPFGKKPKPEAMIVSVKPDRSPVKVGEAFKAVFELEITPGWHIYPTTKTTTGEPTQFTVEGAEIPGKIEEEPKAKVHPAEGDQPAYDYHEGSVRFTVPLYVKPGPRPGPAELKGALRYIICNPSTCLPPKTVPFSIAITLVEGEVAPPPVTAKEPPPGGGQSFSTMLLFAFLGGLLLNVMPCVLPVLTLKLISLVKQKDTSAGERRNSALAYTAGVLLCLNAFALVPVILRALGRQIGWGTQFQQPWFVIALTTLIFVFALSLLGVFHIPALATGVAAQAGRRHDAFGHLLTGLFVTLVATPCSAPFLGTGLGFAFTLPSWGIFLFFSAAGLGLALPFLLVGFVPGLLRFLPKPGPWVEVFEKIMGFTFIATTVWLTGTLASLTGQAGVLGFLAFLTAVSLGAWIFGRWGSEMASGRARLISLGVAVFIAIVAGKIFLVTEVAAASTVAGPFRTEGLEYSRHIPWQKFSEENVAAIKKAKRPGFIDFTADW